MGRVTAAALAALALAGCGERREPVDEAPVSYPLTVAGVVVPEPPDGGVEGSDTMVALIEALGASDNVIAPDVRIAWATDEPLPPDPLPTYVGPADTVDDVVRGIGEVGVFVGRPAEARKLIDRIVAARERVRAAVAGRSRVPVFVDLGFYATAGDRTLIGDLVREAGGENVAGATPEPGPFPLKLLAERDPEVYVISSASRTRPEDLRKNHLRKNPRTKNIAAVREGRIVVVPNEALLPGPRIGQGLLAIAQALHPDAFD
jgi:iron complex transport system substrate-binding protein